jgi:DNA invertase Pin-like site-specific DNA recombinase
MTAVDRTADGSPPTRAVGCGRRKSSEERLEQEFNSQQAQREACEAFITSQRQEGWVSLRAGYDDGGFSGATMARPALQRLLAEIAAGRVDIVVVYKIDQLARSLTDFAKIVEILDARGASFVSVTQQFNTTTSKATEQPRHPRRLPQFKAPVSRLVEPTAPAPAM